MKRIIICEGKHDSIFLRALFPKIGIPDKDIEIFDQGERDKKEDLRNIETKIVGKFLSPYGPYSSCKILVKSEEGKGNAIHLFAEYLTTWIQNFETFLMLDTRIERMLNKLKEMIKNKHGNFEIECEDIKDSELLVRKCYLKDKNGNQRVGSPFYLILFVHSLEEEANRTVPSDNVDIEGKISKLVELPDIQDTFSSLF
ncbi:MAG: hypothetical protein CVT88_01020 [Candidatus Altiarchaeales archaeon HGW-Altiarchaeales-1]|nr:MAG: hypothetical protein CVT88_01020 [Candidatus Altiarchaeales archaeon HGW-Altiarchaeales-1]